MSEEVSAAKKKKVQLAQFALFAPLVAWGIMIYLQSEMQQSRILAIAIGALGILLFTAGLISSVMALCAIPKHGRKGLLGMGVAGLLLNMLLLGLLLIGVIYAANTSAHRSSVLTAEKASVLPITMPGATAVYNEERHYRFEVPQDFEQQPVDEGSALQYVYTKALDDESVIAFTVEPLDSWIGDEPLTMAELEKSRASFPLESSHLGLMAYSWNGRHVDAIHMQTRQDDTDMFVLVMQVPLLPKAVQFSLAGPVEREQEIRDLSHHILRGVHGKFK